MTGFADPVDLAQAAFRAYLAGDSRALCDMTPPDAARWYHAEVLRCVAGWLRLEQISGAVESGTLTPETVSAFSFDENAPVDDRPLYHLPGVSVFRDITLLDPADFLWRAFAGGAEIFGYPSRSDNPWPRNERFEIRGPVSRDGDLARVPYLHTQNEPDGPDSTCDSELVAKMLNSDWLLWFDRELFTPMSLFLHQ